MLDYTSGEKSAIDSNLHIGANRPFAEVTIGGQVVPVESVEVDPAKNGAGQASITIHNKDGFFAPDQLGVWKNILWPNNEISISLGYGANREAVFNGLIDTVRMKTFPQKITISARDKMKRALDQTVTDDAGLRSLVYTGRYIEEIFIDLAKRAGWEPGGGPVEIFYDVSRILIDSITFVHETYANAMSRLCDLYNYEFFAGRYGEIYFNYVTDRQPEVVDEVKVMSTTVALAKFPIVTASIRVRSAVAGGGTLYSSATDYLITEGDKDTAWTIARRVGSTIPSGGTVYVSYVYAAWVFEEGKNLFNLEYTIDDKDLFAKATVLGKTSTGAFCMGSSDYVSKAYYNVLEDKVLIISDDTATSAAQCVTVADRALTTAGATARIVSFEAVAVPYLWIGDCIMIIESSSTISEIYRITNLRHKYNGKKWTMSVEAKHYGYAPA